MSAMGYKTYARRVIAFLLIGFFLLSSSKGDSSFQVKQNFANEKFNEKDFLDNLQRKVKDFSTQFGSKNPDSSDDFVITHPTEVDHLGEFRSYRVKFNKPDKSRRKRDLDDFEREKSVYFKLRVGPSDVIINVTKNNKLFNPNFVVERIRNPEKGESSPAPDSIPHRSSLQRGTPWPCHYRGHVIGHDRSAVAISTCNGLTGLIRLNEADYFVEPMTRSLDQGQEMQPHRVFKRDVTRQRSRRSKRSVDNFDVEVDEELDSSRTSLHQSNSSRTPRRNFCGVKDTKLRYRQELRNRAKWEAHHGMTSSLHRVRRNSVSLEHWIELMLVLDRKMVEYYEAFNDGEVEKYALTVVNMVAELFHDESIGNLLHLTLIRLILIEGDEKALKVSHHAEKTLDSFCRWAKRMNPRSDNHDNHHDVAVLLTRRNICSRANTSCETLGLAHVAGMCQSHRSCNVNQDTGLSVAFTIAHELGHNFAMHHDGQLNRCKPEENHPRVMAPHLTSNNLPMRWSPCSKKYVTRFLDRNWGSCLLDRPKPEQDNFVFPPELPGVLYDANHQCRLMFGQSSRHCRGIDNMCNRLWCLHQGTCRSRLHSAVPGTKCGRGRWCFGGACVQVGKRPLAVDGGWSTWGSWSKCSRTCGVGVTSSARHCDKPLPQNGGRYCLGERKRYRTCNIWDCPKKERNMFFRRQQCSEFDNVLYRNKTYTWLPVDSAIYPCELHCYTRADNRPFADRLKDKVIDGTKCYSQGDDICVDGVCKRLGCDNRIDSLVRRDRCGVCHGDGSSCSDVVQKFTRTLGDAYVTVGILPKGAMDIRIHEVNSSENVLALKDPKPGGSFFLNGDYRIKWSWKFDLADTTFNYERINKSIDNITAQGPISFDIEVMVLFIGKNPGIEISYAMPHNVTSVFKKKEDPVFTWMMQRWGGCSRSCGQGIQVSRAVCIERKSGTVDDDFCDVTERPDDRKRTCHHQPCPAEWLAGPWQHCSVTCGAKIGRQRRTVLCIRSLSDIEQVVLKSRSCRKLDKPKKVELCPAASRKLCPTWRAGNWSQCSASCNGTGYRNRTIQCVTYVINDVIVERGAVDLVGNDRQEKVSDKGDANNPPDVADPKELDVYQSVMINGGGGGIARMIMNKISIVNRRRKKKKKLFETLDYDVMEDADCSGEERPHVDEVCQGEPCPIPTKKARVVIRDPLFDLLDHTPLDNSTSSENSRILPKHNLSIHSTGISPKQGENLLSKIAPPNGDNDLLDVPPFSVRSSIKGTNVDQGETPFSIKNLAFEQENQTNSQRRTSFDVTATNATFPKDLIAVTTATTTTATTTTQTTTTTETTTTTTESPVTQKPRWLTGYWGQCSTSCGVGARIRNVLCSGGDGRCDESLKPPPAERCNLRPCSLWMYGGWTKCSRLCGRGLKFRKIQCRDEITNELLRPFHCKTIPRLRAINATCDMKRCLPWKTSRWSRCNATCGEGIQRRRIACPKEGMCYPDRKPPTVQPCSMNACVEWRTSKWERCSVNCGTGLQQRMVACVETDTGKASTSCNKDMKPRRLQKCNLGKCRVTDFDFSSCTGDRLKTVFCQVLKKWGKCVQPSLAIQCCQTCKTFTSVRSSDSIE